MKYVVWFTMRGKKYFYFLCSYCFSWNVIWEMTEKNDNFKKPRLNPITEQQENVWIESHFSSSSNTEITLFGGKCFVYSQKKRKKEVHVPCLNQSWNPNPSKKHLWNTLFFIVLFTRSSAPNFRTWSGYKFSTKCVCQTQSLLLMAVPGRPNWGKLGQLDLFIPRRYVGMNFRK